MITIEEPTMAGRTPIRRQTDLRLRDPKGGRAVGSMRRLGWAALGSVAQPPPEREWIQVAFYHWVLEDQRESFRRQLESLSKYGDFLSLDEAVELLRSGARIGGRYFCVTFDDGFKNCLANAVPVLRDLEIPAAFFVATKYIGLDLQRDWEEIAPFYERSYREYEGAFEFLTWDECREMVAAGFTLGSHTHSHRRLAALAPAEVEAELRESKQTLEAGLEVTCRHFCCPWGKVDRDFDPALHPAIARDVGYHSFLTTEHGLSLTGDSPFYIRRMGCEPDHHPSMLKYALFSHSKSARSEASRATTPPRERAPAVNRTADRPPVTGSEPELVRVRKFPYPYQAAFVVSSDIDSASVARFRAIHDLVCGNDSIEPTSASWKTLGLSAASSRFDENHWHLKGFGLDFADSFFLIGDPTTFGMYRHVADTNRFVPDEEQGQDCKALLQECIRNGQVDSFHAFLHHTRSQVEPLLRDFYTWCEEEEVPKPRVWINHSMAVTPSGLCPAGLQPNPYWRLARLSVRNLLGPMLGRRRVPLRYAFARYSGDNPSSPHYINDLLAGNGLRFVWLNADDLDCNRIALDESMLNGRSTILEPVTMADGVRYYRFRRCYGRPPGRAGGEAYLRDSADGFDSTCLITEDNLAALCRAEGTCILYTHWAHSRSFPLRDDTIARFALLRRWRDEGKIWVTPTSRLLEWTRRRTFLSMATKREGTRLVVRLDAVEDPLFGREPVSLGDLDGLSFELAEPCSELQVCVGDVLLSPEHVRGSGQLRWLDAKGGAVTWVC